MGACGGPLSSFVTYDVAARELRVERPDGTEVRRESIFDHLDRELRRTSEFLNRILNSTVDGIIAANMRGTILLFNQGAERICGYKAGEVIGLLGDNGAGKSTAMKIITGVYQPSAGEMRFMGTVATARTPADSRKLGIEMVYSSLTGKF